MKFNVRGGIIILFVLSVLLNVVTLTRIFIIDTHKSSIKDSLPADNFINKDLSLRESLDILDLPLDINSWNFDGEGWKVYFHDKKATYPLTYNNHTVGFIGLSPSHKKLGFYFYPEDHALSDIVLAVLDIDQKTINEVYKGDTWTSNWEWKGDMAIIVKRKCGTGCMNANVFDINTGKQVETYRVY